MLKVRYAVMLVLVLLAIAACGESRERLVSPTSLFTLTPRVTSASLPTPPVTSVSDTSSTASPISVDLVLSKAPRLNESAFLTCTIKSAFDAPDSVASVELPEGAVKIDGDLRWQGDLNQNIPVQLSATIKFTMEGDWVIKAVAKHVIDEKNWWGDEDYIYLNVTKESGQFGFSEKGAGQEANER